MKQEGNEPSNKILAFVYLSVSSQLELNRKISKSMPLWLVPDHVSMCVYGIMREPDTENFLSKTK